MHSVNSSANVKSARKKNNHNESISLSSNKKSSKIITQKIYDQPLKQRCADKQNINRNNIEQCLLHSKNADLVCLTDGAIICSNCALFGNHKGHQVMNVEGIVSNLTQQTQKCLDLYEQMNRCWEINGHKIMQQNLRCMLQDKKNQLIKQIDFYYKNLIDELNKQKKHVISDIDEWQNKILQNIQNQLQSSQQEMIQQNYKKWCDQLQQMATILEISNYSHGKIEDYLKVLPFIKKQDNLENQIFYQGKKIIQKRQYHSQSMYTQIDRIISQAVLQFQSYNFQKSSIFKQKVQNCRNLLEQFEKTEQDNLLISVAPSATTNSMHYPISIIPPKEDRKFPSIAEQVSFDNVPHLSISDICQKTNRSSNLSSDRFSCIRQQNNNKTQRTIGRQTIVKSNLIEKQQINEVNETNKKKKKNINSINQIQVAEKYKSVLQDLKNDRAETIDLTNAELTDNYIGYISSMIEKNEKAKLLKLIKNKLTDCSVQQLIRSSLLRNKGTYISINLSQNNLTDKCISLIEKQLIKANKTQKNIKSITLSMNKLNRRSVKQKIEEISKKWNINIIV